MKVKTFTNMIISCIIKTSKEGNDMENNIKGKYNAIDIARYVINKSNEKGYDISNLKLQKILYFVQAEFISKTPNNELCFNDKMEAWTYGPVVPNVYREFKWFGSNQIPPIKKVTGFDFETLSIKDRAFVIDFIDNNDEKMINDVIDECSMFGVMDLVNITHGQIPWKNAINNNKEEISYDDMIKAFS